LKSADSLLIKDGLVLSSAGGTELLEGGWILIADGRIASLGKGQPGKSVVSGKPEVIDAGGRLVLPGLVNCHTHLYSTLARGMAVEGASPRSFKDQLESVWWRLDRALTYEDCYWSALVGSLLSLKAGVTTVLDHHSSPYAIDRSLDAVASGLRHAGLRGSVCYEVSDRDGQDRASLGVYENVRFARAAKESGDGTIVGMMGLHASFTLSQPTLLRACEAARRDKLGFHVHAAEDEVDVRDSQKRYRRRVITRLAEAGVLGKRTLAIHGVHLSDSEIANLSKSGANLIHCPRSNFDNAVGTAPVGKMFRHGVRVGLGSDGFGCSVLDDALAALYAWRQNDRSPAAGSKEIELMLLKHNPVIASTILNDKLGAIAEGYLADLVIASYDSPTPITIDNIMSHLLSRELRVETVLVGGRKVVSEGRSVPADEPKVFERARQLAGELWGRI
jgi:putative selenium metabolism protein SsnA